MKDGEKDGEREEGDIETEYLLYLSTFTQHSHFE